MVKVQKLKVFIVNHFGTENHFYQFFCNVSRYVGILLKLGEEGEGMRATGRGGSSSDLYTPIPFNQQPPRPLPLRRPVAWREAYIGERELTSSFPPKPPALPPPQDITSTFLEFILWQLYYGLS